MPPNGRVGSAAATEPVASTTCSARTTCGPVSVSMRQDLPSTISAWPCRILTRWRFSSAPTPLVRRPTMPSFHSMVRGEVDGRTLDPDAERRRPRLLDGVMEGVGGMDQRLRRDAADIEAGAAQPASLFRLAALLDQHGVEAELAGADRRDVAAGPAAHDQDLGIDLGHLTPL